MKNPIGRGLLGSIRGRANYETRELSRTNRAARRARYGPLRRMLRGCIDERTILGFLVAYGILWAAISFLVIIVGSRWPAFVPAWQSATLAARLKDISGFLVAAQVGLLAIGSVAIGVRRATMRSRRGLDWSNRFPEIAIGLGNEWPAPGAVASRRLSSGRKYWY